MNTRELKKARRKNAKLYPIYKMLSWDLLFYNSIEFLFFTITKGITTTEFLIISGAFVFFKVLTFVPAVAVSDIFGKRKSMIAANFFVALHLIILLFCQGMLSILVAMFVCALGFSIKAITDSNLLYDSVATKGGDGLYEKIEAKGGTFYYLLDGIASLTAGYFFVVNQYLPIYICLGFAILATIVSIFFKEIYEPKDLEKGKFMKTVKEYSKDLKVSMKFIVGSRRMKSYILFGAVFYGIITVYDTYKGDLLVDIGISEEQFSMIFAILTFIGGLSVALIKSLEKKFKNRVLTFLSMTYILSYVIVGFFVTRFQGNAILPMILFMYGIARIATSNWYILEYKYLKNFSEPEMRNKITFAYEFVGGITASIIAMLGGWLVDVINIKDAFLVFGLVSLAVIILILDYMRTRFGLKPEEYRREDIEFVEKE